MLHGSIIAKTEFSAQVTADQIHLAAVSLSTTPQDIVLKTGPSIKTFPQSSASATEPANTSFWSDNLMYFLGGGMRACLLIVTFDTDTDTHGGVVTQVEAFLFC